MTAPADETGYSLDLVTGVTAGSVHNSGRMGISPDGLYGYVAHGNGIDRLHLATGTIDAGWGTSGSLQTGSACDAAGNVYCVNNRGAPNYDEVVKWTPAGGAATHLCDLPTGNPPTYAFGAVDLCLGRDGNLYLFGYQGGGPGNSSIYQVYQVTLPGALLTEMLPLHDTTVSYISVAAASDGTIWLTILPSSSSPYYGIDTVLRRYRPSVSDVTDFAIQALVDQVDDGNSEAFGVIFCDSMDHVIVEMATYPTGVAYLSWFLRVTTAGVATRIAGTWSYSSTPPPAATTTNIANGPLNTSLACDVGANSGITQDGKTVYFIDDSGFLSGNRSDLLRKLYVPSVLRATPRTSRLFRQA